MNKIYLGEVKSSFKGHSAGEKIYITKHSWDCGWYWGMGYIGNRNLHTHFDSEFLNGEYSLSNIFESTKLTQAKWWIILDLFKQAYALKHCAEIYRYGGHMTSKQGITDIIENEDIVKMLNSDLEKILNKVWEILEEGAI